MSIVAIAVGLSGIILSFFAGEEFPEYLRARYEFTWCRLCGYTEEQLRYQASKQAADRSRERLVVLSGYAFIALAVYATIYVQVTNIKCIGRNGLVVIHFITGIGLEG